MFPSTSYVTATVVISFVMEIYGGQMSSSNNSHKRYRRDVHKAKTKDIGTDTGLETVSIHDILSELHSKDSIRPLNTNTYLETHRPSLQRKRSEKRPSGKRKRHTPTLRKMKYLKHKHTRKGRDRSKRRDEQNDDGISHQRTHNQDLRDAKPNKSEEEHEPSNVLEREYDHVSHKDPPASSTAEATERSNQVHVPPPAIGLFATVTELVMTVKAMYTQNKADRSVKWGYKGKTGG